ncbi:hypothetical protein TS85_13710 [Sphingomonas hengshuiensis]|uniref:Uncharacterized protein n=2 Tax=Sphingomonas hengshuiensis TaxID=1609977 RepID=A0A7U4J9A7_9SPHN|nr:hypothetical protein TS85_13710 [Sphingomonas hengshuiensis]
MSFPRFPFTAHQVKLSLFVGLWFGAIDAYPLWHHHVVKFYGPTFPTEARARQWVAQYEAGAGRTCMRWASEDLVEPVPGTKEYFGAIRCNPPSAFLRQALAILLPALVTLLALAFFARGKPKRK